jgi:DNA mismatch repair protein MutL
MQCGHNSSRSPDPRLGWYGSETRSGAGGQRIVGRIRILSEELVNQIAAGEVVERPASVVKELIENSLDAGATRIDIAIEHGGLRWICVTDNGVGMSREDAALSLVRHATSKIGSLEELSRVTTLGFRGEALPSIASVSELRLRTRRAEDSIGTEASVGADGASETKDQSCAAGTRVEVAELFARVPARRKFLRSAVTEASHILRGVERLALARPKLRLGLERDGRSALEFLPTADLHERVMAVLPNGVGARLRAFDGAGQGARVHGFTSPTDLLRANANDIHLFVNGRAVRDRLLLFAVRDAYRDALPPGRHPAAVIYLEVDPEVVDVNVHPAKAEVRFRDPDLVRRLVTAAIARQLGRSAHAVKDPTLYADAWPTAQPPTAHAFTAPLLWTSRDAGAERVRESDTEWRQEQPLPGAAPELPFAAHRYLGQVLGTYLVLEGAGTLLLVDQHAAHERVLFEQLRDGWLGGALERQPLLAPLGFELARSAAEALEAERDALLRAGFELEFGGAAIRGGARVGIKAVPALLLRRGRGGRDPSWGEMLEETAAALLHGSAERTGIEAATHHALATAACHAATRRGDRLDAAEVRALLEALDARVWFPNCPHGRPISFALSAQELERRFLRS